MPAALPPPPSPAAAEPRPDAPGASPEGRPGARELALGLGVAALALALYARTLGWPALEVSDAPAASATGRESALAAGGLGGLALHLEGLARSAAVPRAAAALLHAGTSALAFALARALGARRASAALAAALFAAHPLAVGTVAWLSQRGALLGGFLLALAACLALAPGAARALASRAALALALVADPRLFLAAPWVGLVAARSRRARGSWIALDVALHVALALGAAAWLLARQESPVPRPALVPHALASLVRESLLPHGPGAGTSGADAPALAAWAVAAGWLALAALALKVALALPRRPRVALGGLLFLAAAGGSALFPRSEALALAPDGYAALLGVALVLVALLETLGKAALVLAPLLVLVARSAHERVGDWRSEGTLQEAVLDSRPRDSRARVALGAWHARRGRLSRAQELLEHEVRLRPDDGLALLYLGEIELARAGVPGHESRLGAARERLERSAESVASPARAHERLAEIALAEGRPADARAHLEAALAREPARAALHERLARVLSELGEPVAARAAFARALELHPRFAPAWSGLGASEFRAGATAAAEGAFARALVLEPDLVEANALLGRIRETRGDLAGAEASYRRALAVAPDRAGALEVDAMFALGALLSASGRGDEALRWLERVVELRPAPPHVRAHLESARLLFARGERDAARELVDAVLEHNPANADARALLEQLGPGAPR